jgi:hypothetical protein
MTSRLHSFLIVGAMIGMGMITTTRDARAGIVFGGWDSSRGGAHGSLGEGSGMSDIRSDIQSTFSGSSIVSMSTLSASNLAGVQVLIIGSGTGDNTDTTALSSSEQAALLNFVKSGGGAIISVDNDTFAGSGTPAVNNSYISPFGLHATGTLNGIQLATVTDSSSPVTNGPFGLVSSIGTNYPGWLNNLGSNAQSLATLNYNGETMLAAINPGVLGPGSGGVVIYSDSILINGTINTWDDQTLANNTIAFVMSQSVPEPSSLVLGIIASVACGSLYWRRCRGRDGGRRHPPGG